MSMAVMLFPIRLLVKLQLSKHRKWGIILVFSVGAIGICASIIRVDEVRRSSKSSQPSAIWLAEWSMIEAGIGESHVLRLEYVILSDATAKPLRGDGRLPSSVWPSSYSDTNQCEQDRRVQAGFDHGQ